MLPHRPPPLHASPSPASSSCFPIARLLFLTQPNVNQCNSIQHESKQHNPANYFAAGLHRGIPSVPWKYWLLDLNGTAFSTHLDGYLDSAKLNAKEVEARMHALWHSLSAFGIGGFSRINLDNQRCVWSLAPFVPAILNICSCFEIDCCHSSWIDPLVLQVFALHEELTFHQVFLAIFLCSAMLCLAFSSIFHCFLCYSCQGSPQPAPLIASHRSYLPHSFCLTRQTRLRWNRSSDLRQRRASYLLWLLLHVCCRTCRAPFACHVTHGAGRRCRHVI
jgi:hypothetical protein